MKKRFAALLLALAMTALLTGCLTMSVDELYALPEQTDAYHDLQEAINGIMTGDAQYSSPTGGTNQQPVQMADLDGDGDEEAIVFLRTGDTKPLKTYVFDRVGEQYEVTCIIEGDGSAFARVEYAQLDGAGGQEILIGRQISDQVMQSLSVYSVEDGTLRELMNANCSEFRIVDLDGDGSRELFLLRYGDEERAGTAELYRYSGGEMERQPELPTAVTAEDLRSVVTCSISEDVRAILITRMTEETELITDIFTYTGGRFQKTSSKDNLNLHAQTVRGYNVYPADVGDDGIYEFPDVVRLNSESNTEDDAYYAIRWFRFEPGQGARLRAVTYHSFAGGWYLVMPARIGTEFHVAPGEDVSGSRGASFYDGSGASSESDLLFTIYAFAGTDRNVTAASDGRFAVGTKGEVTYSAAMGPAAQRRDLTQDDIVEMFHFIRVDWNSGER